MSERRFLAAVVCLAALAAPLGAVTFDLKLIGPDHFDQNEADSAAKPFVARFKKKGRELIYVGAKHTYSEVEPTIALVRAILEKEKPDLLLFEGFPNKKDPAGFLAYAKRTCRDSYCEGGEPAFAVLTAAAKGVAFAGAEPSDAQVLAALEDQGFSETDLNGFYFTRWIPQLRASGRLLKGNLRQNFAEYVKAFGAEDFKYDDYVIWYAEKNGKTFHPELVDRETVAPRADGRLFTQRVASVVDTARNRAIAALVGEELERRKKVVLMLGASHYFSHEEAFTAALGAPTMRSWIKSEEAPADEPNPDTLGADEP
jgi:hypothetical protein